MIACLRISAAEARDLFDAEAARKPNKYRAKPITVDSHRFPSRLEARRYGELKMLARAGRIKDLRLQPRYKIVVNSRHICEVVWDFAYFEPYHQDLCTEVVEDAKGQQLPLYKVKRALFEALYPDIGFREISQWRRR